MNKLKYYGGNIYPLFLKTLTGETVVLEDIQKNITIKQLKKKVGEKMNIMPKYIRLVWAGKRLGDIDFNNRKNDLQLNGNYGYDFRQDKGIHIILDYKRMGEDKDRLTSRQSLAFMSALLEERDPTNEIDELSNIGSIMANYMKHNPEVLERTDYQDYGYDERGFDLDGYDMDGYDIDGYDPNGYDEEGYDPEGYDRDDFKLDNYNEMANYLTEIQGGSKRNKKMSQNTYQKLLKNKKKLTKRNRKLLDKTMNKKYCSCVKKVRKTLNKRQIGAEYPICTKSIYNNRNIKPPKNKYKNCK